MACSKVDMVKESGMGYLPHAELVGDMVDTSYVLGRVHSALSYDSGLSPTTMVSSLVRPCGKNNMMNKDRSGH